jgi:hypothetical protein
MGLYMVVLLLVCLMVSNATFNNISAKSWRSVLLVEETEVPGHNHQPVASHWQTLSHNVVHLALIEIRTHNISGDTHDQALICHLLLENLYQARKRAIKPSPATCYWITCTKPGNERSSPHLPLVIGEPVPSQEMSNQALITRRKYVPCKWMMTRSFKATTDSRLLGVIVPDPSHHPLFVTLKAGGRDRSFLGLIQVLE